MIAYGTISIEQLIEADLSYAQGWSERTVGWRAYVLAENEQENFELSMEASGRWPDEALRALREQLRSANVILHPKKGQGDVSFTDPVVV